MSRQTPGNAGYLSTDTIAAPATAAGGAVAIIRLSGPDSARIVRDLTRNQVEPTRMPPRTLLRSGLYGLDPRAAGAAAQGEIQDKIDDALVAWFPAPHSYTGEDVAEVHVHGGTWTVSRALGSILSRGARMALPGEFSFRAVRNGKMNVSQAEAVADLIGAGNDAAATLALEKMNGAQSDLVSSLADELRKLAALGEVGIDFSDQDVDEVSLPRLRVRAREIAARLQALADSYERGARIQGGIRTALIGRPNAGKSSFFNALLGEDRAIVSEVAGTTRDIVRERVTVRGASGEVTLRLEDTAGLRETSDPVERIGVARTRQAGASADLVIWVVDARSDPGEIEEFARDVRSNREGGVQPVAVLAKCDIASKEQIQAARSRLVGLGLSAVLETASVTGEGIPRAARTIADACAPLTHRAAGEVLLTREIQAQATREAIVHLERALTAGEIELFAADIRHALAALSPLFGDTPAEDVLTRIFSTFCIGK